MLGFHVVGGRLGGATEGRSLEQRPTYGQPEKAPMTGDQSGRVYQLTRERKTHHLGVPSRPSIVLKKKKKATEAQAPSSILKAGTEERTRLHSPRGHPVTKNRVADADFGTEA